MMWTARLAEHNRRALCVVGLVLMLLGPFLAGYRMVNFSPLSFLADPLMWLRAVSKYRAIWTAAPDFAYKLCSKRAAGVGVGDVDMYCLAKPAPGVGERTVPAPHPDFSEDISHHSN
ncbi:MAG: hypothetical protein AAF212_10120, partial [Verrucomicrobiota bacterium]